MSRMLVAGSALLLVGGIEVGSLWKKESGWISTCVAAACPGMHLACMTRQFPSGHVLYCYRDLAD